MSRYGSLMRAFIGKTGGLKVPGDDPIYTWGQANGGLFRVFDVNVAVQNSTQSPPVMNYLGWMNTTVSGGGNQLVTSMYDRMTGNNTSQLVPKLYNALRAVTSVQSPPSPGVGVISNPASPNVGFGDAISDAQVREYMLTNGYAIGAMSSFTIAVVAQVSFTPQGAAARSPIIYCTDAMDITSLSIDYRLPYGGVTPGKIRVSFPAAGLASPTDIYTEPSYYTLAQQTCAFVLTGFNYYDSGAGTYGYKVHLDIMKPDGTYFYRGDIASATGLVSAADLLDASNIYVTNDGFMAYAAIANRVPAAGDFDGLNLLPAGTTQSGNIFPNSGANGFTYAEFMRWLRVKFLI